MNQIATFMRGANINTQFYAAGRRLEMSLRWIHENLEAPTCDEECSDIDDSCSDDSYDTDLFVQEDNDVTDSEKGIVRKKRETKRPPTTIAIFEKNGYSRSDS